MNIILCRHWFDPTRNQPKPTASEADALTIRPSELCAAVSDIRKYEKLVG